MLLRNSINLYNLRPTDITYTTTRYFQLSLKRDTLHNNFCCHSLFLEYTLQSLATNVAIRVL